MTDLRLIDSAVEGIGAALSRASSAISQPAASPGSVGVFGAQVIGPIEGTVLLFNNATAALTSDVETLQHQLAETTTRIHQADHTLAREAKPNAGPR